MAERLGKIEKSSLSEGTQCVLGRTVNCMTNYRELNTVVNEFSKEVSKILQTCPGEARSNVRVTRGNEPCERKMSIGHFASAICRPSVPAHPGEKRMLAVE